MGALMRTIGVGLLTMVAGYTLKKMMASVEAQAEKMREAEAKAREPNSPKDMKQLKQDPVTGVYYAED
jgi:formiminotetrahydrofolate cyclodeaminase